MAADLFNEPVGALKGVGPKRAKQLKMLGISTVEDFIWFFPRKYEDRRHIAKIADLVPGRSSTVLVTVADIERRRLPRKGLELVVATLTDETGELTAAWFNRRGIEYILKPGTRAALYGVPAFHSGAVEMPNPEFEVADSAEDARRFARIIPIYSSTEGLQNRWFRGLISEILRKSLPRIEETLPEEIREKRNLVSLRDALQSMHEPSGTENWKAARRRLAYEELLMLQAGMALRREKFKQNRTEIRIDATGPVYRGFHSALPFTLTQSQGDALSDIFADLQKGVPMSRLLQGDVGAGKTLVAIGLAAAAADVGVQTAVMAPTEVLALQLFSECQKWLAPLGVKSVLLKGGQNTSERRAALASICDGRAAVVVGTQVLLESSIGYKNLGVVVIDEQHRFGVMQRAAVIDRVPVPHLLLMSATPIPRTLTLCLFGDLDVSLLREKPAGRKKSETRLIDKKKIRMLLQFILDEVKAGGRAYWVCPRVEGGEAGEIASVEKRFAFVKKYLNAVGVGLIHGGMKSEEKENVLARFRDGSVNVLVGTTVVEVGVDVPDASVMVIESPERFGLSQLHQLRGRVGRGMRRGVCVLLLSDASGEAPQRLQTMLETDDGFAIAEVDLLQRGTGELSGVSQHGMAELRVADLQKDTRLLDEAREDAKAWIANDPQLQRSPLFTKKLYAHFGQMLGVA